MPNPGVPALLRRFHLTMTGIWAALVIPTLCWWSDSILWVALMSAWANVMAHFAAYMAGRTEKHELDREDQ
jgi:hypothetical protein